MVPELIGGSQKRGPTGPALRVSALEIGLAWTGFGALVWLLYGDSISGWWAWDDSQVLKAAFQGRPWEYYAIPSVWCHFQPANLNPWIIFSYDADLALFGLKPQAFYAHQLLALWVVACMTHLLLRMWANRLWAILGVCLFLLSAPVTNTAYQLMTRHYLEGLLFFGLACYLFIRAARDELFLVSWVGAGFYLLAMSAKETYVVLALFFPLIPIRDIEKRLRTVLPFFVAMGLYAVWRRYMLGTWVGGYRPALDWAVVYSKITEIPSIIFGHTLFGTTALVGLGGLLLYAAWRHPNMRVLLICGLVLLLGPIIPAVYISDLNRLLFLFTWTLSVTVALCLSAVASSNARRTVLALAMLTLIAFPMAVQGWRVRNSLSAEAQGYEAHGRFVMEAGRDHVLLPSVQFGNWFTEGMAWIRRHELREQPPVIAYDEIDLLALPEESRRLFVYDAALRQLKEIPEGVSTILSEWRQKVRNNPISVAFDYKKGVLSWDLGPYEEGQYSIIAHRAPEFKVVVPRIGFKRRKMSDPLVCRIRYDSPEGWIAYSPLMHFDGKELKTITSETDGLPDTRGAPLLNS